MLALHVKTKDGILFVHLSSTLEKAIEWIRKYGDDWAEDEYCFFVHSIEVDLDDYEQDEYEMSCYIDLKGNIHDNIPLN